MEALTLARMASESSTEFDCNVGVSKCGDEAMPQAVKAPRGDVASRTTVFGFPSDPGVDSRTFHNAPEGHARARVTRNRILREGGKQRGIIACSSRVFEQKGFDFGMDGHR